MCLVTERVRVFQAVRSQMVVQVQKMMDWKVLIFFFLACTAPEFLHRIISTIVKSRMCSNQLWKQWHSDPLSSITESVIVNNTDSLDLQHTPYSLKKSTAS